MLKPCLQCGALSDQSRCPRHRRRSRDVLRFRRRMLRQGADTCVVYGRTPVVAHHPIPLSEGGTDDQTPMPLCAKHHADVHARLRGAWMSVA